MKVAVVFIGTGKYLNFLPSWYERCEDNFLPGVDKQYFVFTDGMSQKCLTMRLFIQ